jgi:hypothetical protein
MINLWYELTTSDDGSHNAAIIANSDMVDYLKDFDTEKEAEIAAIAFIQGLKFARGEE